MESGQYYLLHKPWKVTDETPGIGEEPSPRPVHKENIMGEVTDHDARNDAEGKMEQVELSGKYDPEAEHYDESQNKIHLIINPWFPVSTDTCGKVKTLSSLRCAALYSYIGNTANNQKRVNSSTSLPYRFNNNGPAHLTLEDRAKWGK